MTELVLLNTSLSISLNFYFYFFAMSNMIWLESRSPYSDPIFDPLFMYSMPETGSFVSTAYTVHCILGVGGSVHTWGGGGSVQIDLSHTKQ